EHELTDLIVEADLSAAEEAVRLVGDVETERVAPVLLGPAVADMSADIEAGPVIGDRQHARGRRLVDRLRNICRLRGAAERGRAYQSDKQTTHRALMHLVLSGWNHRAPRDRLRPAG